MTDPFVGTLLAGRYAVRSLLGGGAMGSVYRARQVWLERDVAVKVLRPGVMDSRARRRLHREARAVARIQNPHVVQVHDYGETPEGAPFLVMELVPGPTAGAWFRSETPGVDAILDAIDGVLAGLAAAHARGVLHRDLKPANMLLRDGEPGQMVLVDFGIAAVIKTGATSAGVSVVAPAAGGTLPDSVEALLQDERTKARAARRGEERITQEGTVVGTPLYMAPEQALGLTVGPRADVYAAAVVLYEWLAGDPPFRGTVQNVMRGHAYEPAPPLRARSGLRVPESVRLLVARALAKDPADRPESAGAMRAELRALRDRPTPRRPEPSPRLPMTVELTPEQLRSISGEKTPPSPTAPLSRARRLPVTLPFVGRTAELERLSRLMDQVRGGRGLIALLEGRPGIGTSRLADQFTTWLQEEGREWVGRGSAITNGFPHAALRQAVEDVLEARALGGDALRERIHVAVGDTSDRNGGLNTQEREALLGWLRPEAGSTGAVGGWEVPLLERTLRVLATVRPVVLWLDGVGRSGVGGAQVLEQLGAALRIDPFPLLILATRTAEVGAQGASRPWQTLSRQEGEVVRQIVVGPLSDKAVVDLAQGALPLTDAAAARIAERAGGSPLVAGHLLRHLVDSDRLVDVGRRLDLAEGDSLSDALPSSLRAMMEERLERARDASGAPDEAALVLQVGAALGARFSVDVLADALGAIGMELSDAELDDRLDDLIGAGVLREPEDHDADDLDFDHPAMVEVLVSQLVAGRRGRRRARALATWLAESPEALRDRLAAPLVRLLDGCGAHDLLPEPAVRAGGQALAAGQLGDAIRLFDRALEHGASGELRRVALEQAATANQLLGHHDIAIRRIEELLLDPEGPRARALSLLGRSQLALGQHDAAAAALAQALPLHRQGLPAADAAREVARTLSALARLGHLEEVDPGLLDAVRAPQDAYIVAVSLGYIAGRRGDTLGALRLLGLALSAARRAGYRPGIVTTLFDLGWTERRAGRVDDARAHLRECLSLASALGRRPMLARAHNELGEIARAESRFVDARRHYAEAASLREHLDGPEPLVAELNLAFVEVLAGETESGRSRLEAMQIAERVPAWLMLPWSLTMTFAEVAGDTPGAEARLDRALALLADTGAGPEAGEILLKIADGFAEKGADGPSARARAAAEGLLPGD